MITGSVNLVGEAIVTLRLRGPQGTIQSFQGVIDTGFNDWLTLSKAQIGNLGLEFREEAKFVLADGSQTESRLFTAEIHWHDGWRRILVVEMEGGPLLGMAALRGSFLGVEVVPNGRVEIRPLGGV